MRRTLFSVLCVFAIGCAKQIPPAPIVAQAEAENAEPVAPPKKKWPTKPVDPNNFAGKSLAQWREDLRSRDPARQKPAIMAVQALGPLAAEAVPDLLTVNISNLYRDRNFQAKFKDTIVAIGKPAVPHLIAALADPVDVKPGSANSVKVTNALSALVALGLNANDAIPRLIELANHPEPAVRSSTIFTLELLGPLAKPATKPLLAALNSTDEYVQITAANALSLADPDGSADAALTVLLAVPQRRGMNEHPYNKVTEILPRFGVKAAKLLVSNLKQPKVDPEFSGLGRLLGFKPVHLAPIVPDLVNLLSSVPQNQVWLVLVLIHTSGADAKSALPEILRLAREGPEDVKPSAANAAAKLGASSKDLLPILAKLLQDKAVTTDVVSALSTLHKQGDQKEIASLLTARLNVPKPGPNDVFGNQSLYYVSWNLVCLDPTSVEGWRVLLEQGRVDFRNVSTASLAGLKPHLSHPDAKVRLLAAIHIVSVEPKNAEAIKLLKENLYSETKSLFEHLPPLAAVNFDAIGALWKARAVVSLAELLKHPKAEVRTAAAHAMAELGDVASSESVAIAKAAATESNGKVLYYLIVALGRMGAAGQAQSELFVKAIAVPNGNVRFAAASSLLEFNPADARALATLTELMTPTPPNHGSEPALKPVTKADDASFLNSPYPIGSPPLTSKVYELAEELLYEVDPEAAIRGGAFKSQSERPAVRMK